jgi:hypothetical protein
VTIFQVGQCCTPQTAQKRGAYSPVRWALG